MPRKMRFGLMVFAIASMAGQLPGKEPQQNSSQTRPAETKPLRQRGYIDNCIGHQFMLLELPLVRKDIGLTDARIG